MEISILSLNPWWKTGEIEEEYKTSIDRVLLGEILKYLENRQILSITGLRRVGKTTLIHRIINSLLNKKIKKEEILYYNFDMGAIEIEELLNKYEQTTGIKIKEEKIIFVFLDEIQKLAGWHNKLKLIYDLNRNIKFFISGSASLFIEKRTKESLAGRVFSFQLSPLTFKEFLKFKNFKEKQYKLWREELNEIFLQYLKTGGFPEIVNEKSEEKIKAYIKESVIDRIVYIDIPQVFKIEEPELLVRLISIISSNPGMILDFNNLADDLDRDRKTISAYLFYLEKAFLIKKLYNFSQNTLTSERKGKRFYPSSTALSYFFNAEISKIIENSVAISLNTKFFYRKQNYEVDFIDLKEDKKINAIEVKYKDEIKKEELSGLKYFLNHFNKKFKISPVLITKDSEEEIKIKEIAIKPIPIVKFMLEV